MLTDKTKAWLRASGFTEVSPGVFRKRVGSGYQMESSPWWKHPALWIALILSIAVFGSR